jgi:hypothetical protein
LPQFSSGRQGEIAGDRFPGRRAEIQACEKILFPLDRKWHDLIIKLDEVKSAFFFAEDFINALEEKVS